MLIKKIFYHELVNNAFKILIVLIFILPLTELFKILERDSGGNAPINSIISAMSYGTLASFPMILTIACFISVVVTLNRYSKDSEFVVWLSSGISPFFWLKSVTKFSLPFFLICAISSLFITPWATSKLQIYTDYLTKEETSNFIIPGIFKDIGNSQVLYIDRYSLNSRSAKDIFFQYNNQQGLTYNITASDGKMQIDNDGIMSLILTNGHRYQINGLEHDKYIIDLLFDELKISIQQKYKPPKLDENNISILNLSQLFKKVNENNYNAKAELSWRISIAIMMFVITIMSVPISIQTGRMQNNLVFIIPPLIYAIYNNLILTLNGYINQNKITSIFSVQLIHVLLIIITIVMTYLKTYPKNYFKNQFKKLWKQKNVNL
jgi:lipopolysaccharide export system permease protein